MALAYLQSLEYRVIATNWRCSIGELDIVAWHADCLIFIEVRTRRGSAAGTPEESITPTKQKRLLRLAEAFVQARPELIGLDGDMPPCRIDLVAVEFGATGEFRRLDHIENAVQES